MQAGFGSKFLGVLAIIFCAAASSSGQQILHGPLHQWSFTSPETLLFGSIGLGLGALSGWLRRLREHDTQMMRDKQANEILRRIEGVSPTPTPTWERSSSYVPGTVDLSEDQPATTATVSRSRMILLRVVSVLVVLALIATGVQW